MENKKYLTVTALNKYLAYKIDTDINLRSFIILGEISNARLSKGHLYFVLKDEDSEISAVMFANYYNSLSFTPKDGVKVLVKCSLQLYQKKGTYNLQVTNMSEYGLGALYQNFLKLKEKLSKEGLFAESHKKEIPMYSEKIGLITSGTGDARHDVVSTIEKRFPIATIFLYPALVQGVDAPKSLIKAINRAESDNEVDLLIIARGGGSFEDLSCFNDEELARVIYDCHIPIISGVGHESDYTICDFVSDKRAPTPTGAAVLATSDKNVLISEINNYYNKICQSEKKIIDNKIYEYNIIASNHYLKNFDDIIKRKEENLLNLEKILYSNSPTSKLEIAEEKLQNLVNSIKKYNIQEKILTRLEEVKNIENNMSKIILDKVDYDNNYVDNLIDKLILLNPLNLMKKGYTLTYQNDHLIGTVDNLNVDNPIVTRFMDGFVESKILKITKTNIKEEK